MAELLRVEPEARAIIIGMSVTIVYVGHATIPLGAWKATDSPHFFIGFPLAVSLAAGAICVALAMRFWFVRKNPDFALTGYGQAEYVDREDEEHTMDVTRKT